MSVNLHGIDHDPVGDRIVVSDVGAANASQGPDFASDGQIFVFNSVSSISGPVAPDITIAGSDTLLGNPVDLILTGDDLRVAEKANDFLLVSANIFDSAGGNIAPDISVPESKPEALAFEVPDGLNPDVSDVNDTSFTFNSIASTSNPGIGMAGSGEAVLISPDLDNTPSTFDTGRELESITFDRNGDAYTSFDDGSNLNGGIAIINRLSAGRNGEVFNTARDLTLMGGSYQSARVAARACRRLVLFKA